MDTPVPSLIDQVTVSFALTEPSAVNPSFMDSTTLEVVITGGVISTTFIIYSCEATRVPSDACNITLLACNPVPTSFNPGVPERTDPLRTIHDGLLVAVMVTLSPSSTSNVVIVYEYNDP